METARPRVLVALRPPLLADLVRSALAGDDLEVVVAPPVSSSARPWDVAVLSAARGGIPVRARHIVWVERTTPFSAVVTQVRRRCFACGG